MFANVFGFAHAGFTSNYNPDLATIDIEGNSQHLQSSLTNLKLSAKAMRVIQSGIEQADTGAIRATLESEGYDVAVIRAEFKHYQNILPSPDTLLQEQPSFAVLRKLFEENKRELPRFLKFKFEEGIKPHHALCCLLLTDYANLAAQEKAAKMGMGNSRSRSSYPSFVWMLSIGTLLPQINNPADFIRHQFSLIAKAIPVDAVTPDVLRKTIRDKGLPVPNYFLDQSDSKQFPPHIALLVMLQEGEKESKKMNSIFIHAAVSLFAILSLLLRIVLEVIGGAGAIWGGSEVFTLRTAENVTFWRTASICVGVLCLLRFLTLNVPRVEDEGDILGPAGPWSLRLPVRLRAVCDHPFHYFVRACPKTSQVRTRDTHSKQTARLF